MIIPTPFEMCRREVARLIGPLLGERLFCDFERTLCDEKGKRFCDVARDSLLELNRLIIDSDTRRAMLTGGAMRLLRLDSLALELTLVNKSLFFSDFLL